MIISSPSSAVCCLDFVEEDFPLEVCEVADPGRPVGIVVVSLFFEELEFGKFVVVLAFEVVVVTEIVTGNREVDVVRGGFAFFLIVLIGGLEASVVRGSCEVRGVADGLD